MPGRLCRMRALSGQARDQRRSGQRLPPRSARYRPRWRRGGGVRDGAAQQGHNKPPGAIGIRHAVCHQRPAGGDQVLEMLQILGIWHLQAGGQAQTRLRQHPCADPVGPGLQTQRPSKAPGQTRVHRCQRQPGRHQPHLQPPVGAVGRPAEDARDRPHPDPAQEPRDAARPCWAPAAPCPPAGHGHPRWSFETSIPMAVSDLRHFPCLSCEPGTPVSVRDGAKGRSDPSGNGSLNQRPPRSASRQPAGTVATVPAGQPHQTTGPAKIIETSALPAPGGHFSRAGSGAGLLLFPDRPIYREPSRAGGGNAVRFRVPPRGAIPFPGSGGFSPQPGGRIAVSAPCQARPPGRCVRATPAGTARRPPSDRSAESRRSS